MMVIIFIRLGNFDYRIPPDYLDYFQGLKICIVLGYTGILRVQYTAKLKCTDECTYLYWDLKRNNSGHPATCISDINISDKKENIKNLKLEENCFVHLSKISASMKSKLFEIFGFCGIFFREFLQPFYNFIYLLVLHTGPFKNDVTAKMRFFDPLPPMSPGQTVTNYYQ